MNPITAVAVTPQYRSKAAISDSHIETTTTQLAKLQWYAANPWEGLLLALVVAVVAVVPTLCWLHLRRTAEASRGHVQQKQQQQQQQSPEVNRLAVAEQPLFQFNHWPCPRVTRNNAE